MKYHQYYLALLMCFGLSANAQKLPNMQEAGVYAPANVKIDGKTTEWNNQFQAFNKSTSLFYTMANNSNDLVLAIQTTDRATIEKILRNKLTLTITGKNGAISLTTPVAESTDLRGALASSKPISDSLLVQLNKGITSKFKEINVTGIAAITDAKIPVYNEYGILVAGRVDNNKAYTCELAIPLKFINPVLGDAGSFNYTILVNGMKISGFTGVDGKKMEPDLAMLSQTTLFGFPFLELYTPTDVSGTYSLVKK